MRRSQTLPLPPDLTSYRGSLQVVVSPCWEWDLPDVISANPSLRAWTPTPAALVVLSPVSSHKTSAFPTLATGRRSAFSPCKRLLTRTRFRGCSHSLMFRPAGLLATLAAPTMIDLSLSGSCGFYFRAEHASLPSRASDMLTVRTGQLTVRDFHPIRFAALSAAPLTDRVSAASVKAGAAGASGA